MKSLFGGEVYPAESFVRGEVCLAEKFILQKNLFSRKFTLCSASGKFNSWRSFILLKVFARERLFVEKFVSWRSLVRVEFYQQRKFTLVA